MIVRIQVILAITDDKDPKFESPNVVVTNTESLNRLVPDRVQNAVEDALQRQVMILFNRIKLYRRRRRDNLTFVGL